MGISHLGLTKILNLFDLDTKLEFQRDQENIFTEAGTILRTPPLVKNGLFDRRRRPGNSPLLSESWIYRDK